MSSFSNDAFLLDAFFDGAFDFEPVGPPPPPPPPAYLPGATSGYPRGSRGIGVRLPYSLQEFFRRAEQSVFEEGLLEDDDEALAWLLTHILDDLK